MNRKRMVYEWAPDASIRSVDAQIAGERLEQLRKRAGGLLTAEAIVNDARPEDAPLHPCFEWNDQVAAENFRREQARHVIRGVRVVMDRGNDSVLPVRAFVNVVQGESRGYSSTAYVMGEAELRAQVLQNAWRDLETFRTRYRELEELSEVFNAADKVLESRRGKAA